ncbi:hypothetical protein Ddye_025173 [Dipteronia dyeriana]|uniref:Cation/H+ exchanger transmembrane domain-containing protein n=1 Tax=Dipteronia dyeriana TaxID=168575 RepID=A0AAD9WV57_9ROSI|nr:hypothetical protein Ddye_025173 [Dipteronia dyeriana]
MKLQYVIYSVTAGSSQWQTQNPAYLQIPLLALQLAIMIFLSRILIFIFRPLRQPRFVMEVIISDQQYPDSNGCVPLREHSSNMLLDTFANFGLIYYMFLVGIEMDILAVPHMSKKSLSIATATILNPPGAGAGLYFVPVHKTLLHKPVGVVFWAITLIYHKLPRIGQNPLRFQAPSHRSS